MNLNLHFLIIICGLQHEVKNFQLQGLEGSQELRFLENVDL